MDIERYLSVFSKYGNPGEHYLRGAYRRFQITKSLATEGAGAPLRVLDVGAHWLHHSTLYAMDGHKVTAADLSGMSAPPAVTEGITREFGIEIAEYGDLSNPEELKRLGTGVFDVILFTEIIEHITFNPVRMWSVFYDLLKPSGRVIVTTPNYFHFGEFARRDVLGVLRGGGAGIAIADILGIHTYGHHWRIFSARDLRRYFGILSPDFEITRVEFFDHTLKQKRFSGKIMSGLQRVIPVIRQNLYVEVCLREKKAGITAAPHW